jgi:hypothetical protein
MFGFLFFVLDIFSSFVVSSHACVFDVKLVPTVVAPSLLSSLGPLPVALPAMV